MKACCRGLSVLLFVLVFAGSAFAAHSITQWPDNKAGAVSLSFDDNCPSQISLGIPALNERGLKATFFIITDRVSTDPSGWDNWRNAAGKGHEIGSHTKTHPYLTKIDQTQLQDEIYGSQAVIDAQIPSQKCVSFAYPYGDLNSTVESIASQTYIVARGINCQFNNAPYDFYNLRSCSPDDGDDIRFWTDQAEQQRKWLTIFGHTMTGGGDCYGVWDITQWTSYFDYLKSKNLWAGTIGAMVKYIREKASATLSVVSSSSGQITLSLTDTLDNTIYDNPLTIRSTVPSSWSYVVVQQGSEVTTAESSIEGTETVIYYDAIPNQGLITLTPANPVPEIAGTNPTSATAGGAGFTLTVTGSNFISSSVVRWNGLDRGTTFGSATQLQAAITAADIATTGTASITVYNPPPGGGTSSAVTFPVNPLLLWSISINPSTVVGGTSSTGSVTLTGPAPTDGATVTLTSSNTAVASVPPSVTVAGGSSSATFPVTTMAVAASTPVTITASYNGTSLLATLTVLPPGLVPVTVSVVGTGSVTSSPSGIACPPTCTTNFVNGTYVTLTETPGTGQVFSGWSGACTNTISQCQLGPLSVALSVTAAFAAAPPPQPAVSLVYSLSATHSAPITLAGATLSGLVYIFTTPDTNVSRVVFAIDGGAYTHTEGIPPFDLAGTAVDGITALPFDTTTLANGAHTVTATVTLADGSTRGLTAAVSVANGLPPPTVSLVYSRSATHSAPITLTGATLSGLVYIFTTPDTNVSRVVFAIDSGAYTHTEGTPPFDLAGTAMDEITALPFDTTTLANGAHTVTATVTFADGSTRGLTATVSVANGLPPPPTSYTLTVTKSAGGTVTSSPPGITCGQTCSATFSSGNIVSLTAIPAGNFVFAGWSGSCTGTGACSVSMTQNRSVTATFKRKGR